MAWTVTRTKTVLGNHAVVFLKMTADGATATVETGLKRVVHMDWSKASMTTIVGPNVAVNSNASGIASMGVLGFSGFTSGDLLYATVYGVR